MTKGSRFGTSFLAAVAFLTRLPVPQSADPAPAALRGSLVYFPLIGALVGGVTAGTLALAGLLWPIWLAVLLALLAEVVLTGGLHEDGLADCCDAFGGGWTREDVVRILKDSRIGTYGVLGLVFAVSLKASAAYLIVTMAGFQNWWLWGAVIVAAAAIGRWSMVLTLAVLPPVENRESLSNRFGGGLSKRELICSNFLAIVALAPYAVLAPISFLVSGLLCAAGVRMLQVTFRRRLGGITGDCLGCLCYVGQLLVLLGGAARIEQWTG